MASTPSSPHFPKQSVLFPFPPLENSKILENTEGHLSYSSELARSDVSSFVAMQTQPQYSTGGHDIAIGAGGSFSSS